MAENLRSFGRQRPCPFESGSGHQRIACFKDRRSVALPSDGGGGKPQHLDVVAAATDPQNLLWLADGAWNRDQLTLAGQ